MRDKEIVERFEAWQKKTGKYQGLDVRKLEYEEVRYDNENVFKFVKGQNKYIRKSIKENPGDIPVCGASLIDECISAYVTPLSKNDIVPANSVSFNKDNAKGSRAFFRNYPFVMDRHHIAIVPDGTQVHSLYLAIGLDNLLKSKNYGWGENVASEVEVKNYSITLPKDYNADFNSLTIQKAIAEYLDYVTVFNQGEYARMKKLSALWEGMGSAILKSFFNKESDIVTRIIAWQAATGKYEGLDVHKVEYDEVSFKDKDYLSFNPSKSPIVKTLIEADKNVSFIPMKSVNSDTGQVDVLLSRPIGQLVKGSYRYFENGDVLFAKVTPCMENGNCVIVKNLENGVGFGSSEFYVFRTTEKVHNTYLWHLLRNDQLRKEAKLTLSGAGGLKRVPKSFFENRSFPLPKEYNDDYDSFTIQKVMSEYLSYEIDHIAKQQYHLKRLMEFYREHLDTTIVKVFNGMKN